MNLRKGSQTDAEHADSIPRRVIDTVLNPTHDPCFENVFDDGNGEAMDIVCVRAISSRVLVHLYHCKFSKEATPGARIDDLYAVCGLAQRNIHWRGDVEALLRRLRYRDELRRKAATRAGTPFVTRFERGDANAVQAILHRLPHLVPKFRIFAVQPGLSRARAITSQLELLAVTETYLQDTFGIPMTVYASP